MAIKKPGLKNGLDFLLSVSSVKTASQERSIDGELRHLPIEIIQRGKYQPRKDFQAEALEELASSIRIQGVIQPIVVRKIVQGGYEIIAGERRWRAAQLAGLSEIPALIRDVPDEAAMAMALIENIQRENLNPVEEAIALQRLLDEFSMTHQEVANAVCKSRVTVTNLLRLLNLNADVKNFLERGQLEMGHARALLAMTGTLQTQAANTVIAHRLSVRETEKLVRRLQNQTTVSVGSSSKPVNPDIAHLQNALSEKLGAVVTIDHGMKGKGKLVIQYNNVDELDGILKHIH